MNAIIVTIGDEILIGQIVDTNSAWIAEKLNMAGIQVLAKRSIADRHEDIVQNLEELIGKTDLVLITGGLGPTKDDITKNSLNTFFGGKMVRNEEVMQHIETLFKLRGYRVTEVNRMQADIPDTCIPLRNLAGTAPGMWFEKQGTIFVSMPGVPYEMKGIMENEVMPRLEKIGTGNLVVHKTLMTQGIPESYLSALISDWEEQLPAHIKLAYLPRPGIVRLRLTANGSDRKVLEEELEKEAGKLLKIIPEDIYAFEDITLEKAIGDLLRERHLSISTAESCTGGTVASMITSIPGSSDYFKGSVVAYGNHIKTKVLGVDERDLSLHGAVSEQVVKTLARGVRELMDSDYGIATSGIAGPDGGTEDKPVGTVWIAVSGPEIEVALLYNFGENRGRTITRASITAINMLRKSILGYDIHRYNIAEKKILKP